MAQKVTGYIKLQIPAGKATPAPPVGPALGQHGVNIMAFTKEFNERTQKDMGYIIPVVITVYADHHQGSAGRDRQDQDARPERRQPGERDQHDRRHLPQHGRHRHRVICPG